MFHPVNGLMRGLQVPGRFSGVGSGFTPLVLNWNWYSLLLLGSPTRALPTRSLTKVVLPAPSILTTMVVAGGMPAQGSGRNRRSNPSRSSVRVPLSCVGGLVPPSCTNTVCPSTVLAGSRDSLKVTTTGVNSGASIWLGAGEVLRTTGLYTSGPTVKDAEKSLSPLLRSFPSGVKTWTFRKAASTT